MNKYLEEGELSEAEIILGIRIRTISTEIQPMFCGTAFKNKGVQRMLDAVIDFCPHQWIFRQCPARMKMKSRLFVMPMTRKNCLLWHSS